MALAMMADPLADLLEVKLVKLEIESTDQAGAIREVASLLDAPGCVRDFPGFVRELMEREELSSTVLGHGVAFPHARTDCVPEILLAVGRSRAGVLFGERRVHLLFVIGTPRSKIQEYLVVVGALARILKNPAVRAQLLQVPTPAEFIAALES